MTQLSLPSLGYTLSVTVCSQIGGCFNHFVLTFTELPNLVLVLHWKTLLSFVVCGIDVLVRRK